MSNKIILIAINMTANFIKQRKKVCDDRVKSYLML